MISQSEAFLEESSLMTRHVLPLVFEELGQLQKLEDAAEPVAENNESEEMEVLAELEQRLRTQVERTDRQIEKARENTRTEVREELKDEFEEKIAIERASVAQACERFAKERAKYFSEVETEVVRLALAIAARVLHRESQLDPLLLRGVVKVALEELQETGTATLRVPEKDVKEWNEIVSHLRDGVIVAGDDRIQPGDCILETTVGRVDLGVKAQMEEIEKGFFDLLQQRPA
jgi:flagellar assembly protein FliH